jgi:hypothetical protein
MKFTEAIILNLRYGINVRCKNWKQKVYLDKGFVFNSDQHYADTLDNQKLLNDIETEWELGSFASKN